MSLNTRTNLIYFLTINNEIVMIKDNMLLIYKHLINYYELYSYKRVILSHGILYEWVIICYMYILLLLMSFLW